MPSRFIRRDSIRASYLRKHAEPKQLSSEKNKKQKTEDADVFFFNFGIYFLICCTKLEVIVKFWLRAETERNFKVNEFVILLHP